MFEIKPGLVPARLSKELGFQEFVNSVFQDRTPCLPRVTLEPLEGVRLREHFEDLKRIENALQACQNFRSINVGVATDIRHWCRVLPPFEPLVSPLEAGDLALADLILLKGYVDANLSLAKLESAHHDLRLEVKVSEQIKAVLDQELEITAGGMRLAGLDSELFKAHAKISGEIAAEERGLEEKVRAELGLTMSYSLPRELASDHPGLEKLKASALVQASPRPGGVSVQIKASAALATLMKKQDDLFAELSLNADQKLTEVNRTLKGLASGFKAEAEKRKARVFQYLLIHAKEKLGLVYPEFSGPEFSGRETVVKEGRLPALERLRHKDYQPLSIELADRVSVLLGGNMAGKTTVLKTLYFLLTLVRMGLPVPAARLGLPLNASGRVYFHLPSSGRIENNLSSFTEELQFLASGYQPGDLVIVDELLQSTNPASGGLMSEAFLNGIGEEPWTFVCSSHHFDCLKATNARFFKIGGGDTRFQISKINPAEFDAAREVVKPLAVALEFPLPAGVLNRLRAQQRQET